MNIVYYLNTFPKLSESFILNEIYELERKGHSVAVCARNRPDEQIVHSEFEELDVPTYYFEHVHKSDLTGLLSSPIWRPPVLRDVLARSSLREYLIDVLQAKRCIEFIQSLGWVPDHIHSHFASAPKFPARYMAAYYRIPFTVTAHAFDIFKEPVGEYTDRLLHAVDRIVTISEYNREYIRQQFTASTPIDIVRAGIRPEKFTPTGTTVPERVLTISRFVEKKGLSHALEAVAIAAEQRPDIEYHIIGSGELKSELVGKTEQLGIEDNVRFLDNVDDQRLIAELDEARTFLLPCVVAASGDRDGIPVALMEAMAMKTPPVSTTVSGIPELIDHEENGLLTEPRDPEATADALLALLQNDSDWAEYANNAREKVTAEFNIEKEADKLEAVFRKAQDVQR